MNWKVHNHAHLSEVDVNDPAHWYSVNKDDHEVGIEYGALRNSHKFKGIYLCEFDFPQVAT